MPTKSSKRRNRPDCTQAAFFKPCPGAAFRARLGAAQNNILPRVGRPQRPRSAPFPVAPDRNVQESRPRSSLRPSRAGSKGRGSCAAILLRPRAGIAGRSRGLRVAPCSGGRGDSSLPTPGAASRAGRKRVSAWRRKPRPVRPSACRSRFERCRGSRRPDSARPRGARSSACRNQLLRRARAKASRTLVSLRRPSLWFFTGAGFPAERAGLQSRVAF